MEIVRLSDWNDSTENLAKVLRDLEKAGELTERIRVLKLAYGATATDTEMRQDVANTEMKARRARLIPNWQTNGRSAVFYSATPHRHQGGISRMSTQLVERMAVDHDLRRQVLSEPIVVTHRPQTDTTCGKDPAGGTRDEQCKKHDGWKIDDQLHTAGPVWVNVKTVDEGYDSSQLREVCINGDTYDNRTRTLVYRITLPSALAMLQYHPATGDASNIHGVIPPGTFIVTGKEGDTVDMTMQLPRDGTLDILKLHGCAISLWGGLEFKY